MNQQRTIVLYGPSLSVAAIGAGLADKPGWRTIPVEPASPDATRHLRELRPDVVLYDLAAAQPETTILLMKECPGLLLIGIDLANNQAMVLSCEQPKLFTPDDFMQLIERSVCGADSAPGGSQ